MEIFVTRHGQTDWNVLEKIQGQTDIELNDVGKQQAEETSKLIKNENINLIITSPLKRAKETAQIINKNFNVTIIEDNRLMERKFGQNEGLTKNTIKKLKENNPEMKEIWNYNKNIDCNGIETMHDFCNRIYEFLDDASIRYKDKNILLVTHGGVFVPMNYYFMNEPLEKLVDRISDDTGTESIALTKDEAEAIAVLIKEGKFKPEDFGISLNDLITSEYILNQALKAGYTSAVITLVMQLTPEIIKSVYLLIKYHEIDIEQAKKLGRLTLSASAEGFLRGSIASALTIACQAEKLGKAFTNVSPSAIGALTTICLDVVKSSIMVAAGKMTPREMGANITKEILISSAALAAGTIGQTILPELPVLGYMLGSLVGSCMASVVLNISEKYLISFCIDTGFTCFGLVEQDYTLPTEILKEIGFDITELNYTDFNYAAINKMEINRVQLNTTELNTVDFIKVKRGIIGVNKIGYVLR